MRFKGKFFIFAVFLFLSSSVHGQEYYRSRSLTEQEIERIKAVKELLEGVDKDSLHQTIRQLEKTKNPLMNIEMREAMAKAFVDIVREEDVAGQEKKEWLYSMVCLNMAYLQFGGSKGTPGSTTELNRLIRQKLVRYLPSNFLNQPGFVYSLE